MKKIYVYPNSVLRTDIYSIMSDPLNGVPEIYADCVRILDAGADVNGCCLIIGLGERAEQGDRVVYFIDEKWRTKGG
jgi:hypothetical protein